MKPRKKGSVIDLFLYCLIFLVIGIVFLVSMYTWDKITPLMRNTFGTGSVASDTLSKASSVYRTFDFIFMGLLFMMYGIPILFAVLVRTHPVFMIINIILIITLFFITPVVSNVMYEFWNRPEFAQYAAGGSATITFPIMSRLFQYFPMVTLGISIILMIAMFAKNPDESGL